MTNDISNFFVRRYLEFFKMEAAGGIVLFVAAILALIAANSSLYPAYDHVFNGIHLKIGWGETFSIDKTPLHWINDGLMAIFFLMVGLEIKREFVSGSMTTFKTALLPVLVAIGGMAVPAAFYLLLNHNHPEAISGWAIPTATDIAFALGVLSLLGNRVPLSVKVLLLATAIMDDLGAIMVIAVFYTEGLNFLALALALIPIAALLLLNRSGVRRIAPYVLLGAILWVLVLQSGIHATLAGVITALFIPLKGGDERHSPAERLEHGLHPWVAFFILPLFGFANAGVPFDGMGLEALLHPVTLGIVLGLVLGKQIGIFGALWISIKSGLCPKIEGAGWRHLYGMAILCGIGFTMSLFIGGLAFEDQGLQASVRLGVLAGSFISAIAGYMVLRSTSEKA